jgi:hypothetical protein
LLLVATGAVISTSLPVIAAEDRADHNWNDPYWHHSNEGYWHGHRGHWEYRDHKHTFIQVGPVTIKQHWVVGCRGRTAAEVDGWGANFRRLFDRASLDFQSRFFSDFSFERWS